MAWTQAQIRAAKAMYNKKGNRKSWPDCIKAVTKGAKKARVSGTGAKKKTPAKRVSIVKARAKKVTVNMGSLGSMALAKVREGQGDIARLEKMLAAAKTPAEKKQIRSAITGVKKVKTFFKKFV